MIYNYDHYCSDEIPIYGYCVFAGEEPLPELERPGAAYSAMGCQLAESMVTFCADDIFEAITHLFEMYPNHFVTNPHEFHLYLFHEGEVHSLGTIGFGWEQIRFDLRMPIYRDETHKREPDKCDHRWSRIYDGEGGWHCAECGIWVDEV